MVPMAVISEDNSLLVSDLKSFVIDNFSLQDFTIIHHLLSLTGPTLPA